MTVTAKIDLDRFALPYFERDGSPQIRRMTPETVGDERQPSEFVYDPKADPFAANEGEVLLTTARRSGPSSPEDCRSMDATSSSWVFTAS